MIVFHLHIPRTGGTTVGHALGSGFTKERLVKFRSLAQVRKDPRIAQDTVAVTGHFGWGLHQEFGRDHIYFVVLRDPIERVGSLYDYIVARKAHRLSPLWSSTPLHQLLIQNLSPAQLSNGQIWQIGGSFGRRYQPITVAHMEQAWRNLSQENVLVTFTDMLNDGLLQLGGQTGLHFRRIERVHNAASRSPHSAETIDLIRKANALDIELYNRARAAFMHRLENPARLPQVTSLEVYRERIASLRAEQDAFQASRLRKLRRHETRTSGPSRRLRSAPDVPGESAAESFRQTLRRIFKLPSWRA